MVRISLHSTEEINDFNSTLLSVENVSQKIRKILIAFKFQL